MLGSNFFKFFFIFVFVIIIVQYAIMGYLGVKAVNAVSDANATEVVKEVGSLYKEFRQAAGE